MIFRAEVFVTLKPVVNDPQGSTIRSGLHSIGFDTVREVRSGKYLVLTVEGSDEAVARARVDEMARDVLANPVIEDYRVQLEPVPNAGSAGERRA
jgi:phosphoribosylformylglycinamidine synthase subunit PurS